MKTTTTLLLLILLASCAPGGPRVPSRTNESYWPHHRSAVEFKGWKSAAPVARKEVK